MFDYKSIVSDDELLVTFEQDSDGDLVAIEKKTGDRAGFVHFEGTAFDASSDADIDVFMQYKLYQTRPERAVGKLVNLEGKNLEQLVDIYEELFIGAYIAAYGTEVPKNKIARYVTAIDWLRTTDFYTAPASTQYHDSNPGGLLVHSLKVYNKMIELSQIDSFKSVNIAEATIAALSHDWCKIGLYEGYERNVKNEQTGQWERVPAYRMNQRGIPLGHGAASLFIAQRMISLTVEQALAIRWHMAEYHVADNEINEYSKASREYPMCYLIQFADRLACTEY